MCHVRCRETASQQQKRPGKLTNMERRFSPTDAFGASRSGVTLRGWDAQVPFAHLTHTRTTTTRLEPHGTPGASQEKPTPELRKASDAVRPVYPEALCWERHLRRGWVFGEEQRLAAGTVLETGGIREKKRSVLL